MKSDNAKKGVARAPHRSLFYAMGYTDEELNRPLVGVCCAGFVVAVLCWVVLLFKKS